MPSGSCRWGDPRPQPPERRPDAVSRRSPLTAEALAAGRLLDIQLLDHLVIGHDAYVSLRDRGVAFDRHGPGVAGGGLIGEVPFGIRMPPRHMPDPFQRGPCCPTTISGVGGACCDLRACGRCILRKKPSDGSGSATHVK